MKSFTISITWIKKLNDFHNRMKKIFTNYINHFTLCIISMRLGVPLYHPFCLDIHQIILFRLKKSRKNFLSINLSFSNNVYICRNILEESFIIKILFIC